MISLFNDYFNSLFSEYWLKNTNTFCGNEPNASVPKENIDIVPCKTFPVLQKVAENFPESGNQFFPNTKFAVKARIIEWVIIIHRLDGVRKFLFKPFLSFDNNLILCNRAAVFTNLKSHFRLVFRGNSYQLTKLLFIFVWQNISCALWIYTASSPFVQSLNWIRNIYPNYRFLRNRNVRDNAS